MRDSGINAGLRACRGQLRVLRSPPGHVPITLRTFRSQGLGAGITNDINEKGIGFVAFQDYPAGSEGEFDISIGGTVVTMPGRIQHTDAGAIDPLLERSKDTINMSSYGALFGDVPVESIDMLMDALMNFVVPMQYDEFAKSNAKQGRFLSWLTDPSQWHRRKENRLSYHLPLGISKQSTDANGAVEIIEAATEDVMPDTVHDHARGERVALAGNGVGQFDAACRQ